VFCCREGKDLKHRLGHRACPPEDTRVPSDKRPRKCLRTSAREHPGALGLVPVPSAGKPKSAPRFWCLVFHLIRSVFSQGMFANVFAYCIFKLVWLIRSLVLFDAFSFWQRLCSLVTEKVHCHRVSQSQSCRALLGGHRRAAAKGLQPRRK